MTEKDFHQAMIESNNRLHDKVDTVISEVGEVKVTQGRQDERMKVIEAYVAKKEAAAEAAAQQVKDHQNQAQQAAQAQQVSWKQVFAATSLTAAFQIAVGLLMGSIHKQ